jgi:hypothetical protein
MRLESLEPYLKCFDSKNHKLSFCLTSGSSIALTYKIKPIRTGLLFTQLSIVSKFKSILSSSKAGLRHPNHIALPPDLRSGKAQGPAVQTPSTRLSK